MISRQWLLPILWLCWAFYWGLAAARNGAPERTEARSSRLIHLGSLAVAFLLLFLNPLSIGPLGWRFVPDRLVCFLLGFAVNTGVYSAVGAACCSLVVAVRRRARLRRGECPQCRYPIGSPPVCSECGTPLRSNRLHNRVS